MKTTQSTPLLLTCLSLVAGSTLQAADVSTMSRLDVQSINKVLVVQTNGCYVMEMDLTFQNKNPEAIKLRNGSFFAKLETKEKPADTTDANAEAKVVLIDFGPTEIKEVEIPGASSGSPIGTSVSKVSVNLGPTGSQTTGRMVKLLNILGDPSAPMTLALQGAAEVGLRLPRGWVFEKSTSYELDLRFVPTIQRDVLFR